MINMIKMDLRKMFQSKSFYALNFVLFIGTLILAAFLSFNLNRDYEVGKDSSIAINFESSTRATNSPDITEEEYYFIQDELKAGLDVQEILTFQYTSPVVLVLLSAFIGLFIGSELDSGFIKNIIPLSTSRRSLVVSKNVVSFVFILIQAGVAFVSSALGAIIVKGSVGAINYPSLLKYLSIQVFLLLAFSSLLIFIAYLFKSKTLSVSVGIILSFNVIGTVLKVVDSFFDLFTTGLSKLTIVGNTVLPAFNLSDYTRLGLIILAYFFIFNILSIIRVKKMEID